MEREGREGRGGEGRGRGGKMREREGVECLLGEEHYAKYCEAQREKPKETSRKELSFSQTTL